MEIEKITINDLDNKIESLTKYFKKYPNKISTANIKKISKDLNNQEYKIAVVANMSAGKSTFINALFGEEVLPAFNHATTDSATFVYSEPNIEKKAIIYFNNEKNKVVIKENLEQEIKQYAQKDEECKNDKYKNVERIKLFYPFQNLQTSSSKDFRIIFIDTPGPNSTGEDYKQKHKDQTRSVLNKVNLALFMFDYTQLDANLSSDTQGLWNTIKERNQKDPNFDVYFILNKIDMAIQKDNFQNLGKKKGDEYKNYKLENWFINEQKAIDKLMIAAEKHGIKKPKIYPITSELQLFSRDKNIDVDSEDDLDLFKKQNFKRVFGNNWEEKFIDYMGILKLEDDINHYIDISVKDKILKKIDSQLDNIYIEENKKLERDLYILRQPKEEATKNLKKAKDFLNVEAKDIQQNFNSKMTQLRITVTESLITKIDLAIENKMRSRSEELAKRVIYFAKKMANGTAERDAKNDAKSIPVDKMGILLTDSVNSITIKKEINIEDVKSKMMTFMSITINEYKNNYLDIQSDIRNIYSKFDEDANREYDKYKVKLENHLNENLNITYKKKKKNIKTISTPKIDIDIPNSSLDYKFDPEKLKSRKVERSKWNPKRWFGNKYYSENYKVEEHTFIINPKSLSESIKQSIEYGIDSFYKVEIKNHQDNLSSVGDDYKKLFETFSEKMEKQVDKLSSELKDKENKLKIVEKQYIEFEKIIKG